MLALHFSGSNEEVVETLALLRLPGLPHTLHARMAEHMKAVAPEAARPLYGVERYGGHLSVAAMIRTGDAPLGTDAEAQPQAAG